MSQMSDLFTAATEENIRVLRDMVGEARDNGADDLYIQALEDAIGRLIRG